MNDSYGYKADIRDPNPMASNFQMPKFLYLLGHGMFDPFRAEESIMYMEIANKYGMSAVKQAHEAVKKGMSIATIEDKFPIDRFAGFGPSAFIKIAKTVQRESPEIALA